ncbi:MAG: hypothetical protein K2N67_06965 [Mucispirillum sp.]|nr:hypothetical protein [Mucispirillum sp.]
MEISKIGNEITIMGNIKNTADYQKIKDSVSELVKGGTSSIIIKTPESFSMTSSVIGFFIKVIYQDKVSIHVYVKDDRLYSLLEDLNLIDTFKVMRY